MEMKEQEQQARNLYHSLDDLNEFGRLLRVGTFAGADAKSITKCDQFLGNLYKEAISQIEANEWYKTEKAEIQKLKVQDHMGAIKGEYDPEYKVNMHDVFRKVIK